MEKFDSINYKLKHLNDELVEYANSLQFIPKFEFTTDNLTNIDWESIRLPGVYLIEIKNDYKTIDFTSWVTAFRKRWEDPLYKGNFVSNLKNIRINRHTELKDWIPLYIGKSKCIAGRIDAHLKKRLDQRTFALKLLARENMKNEIFRLSFLPIVTESYDWVMPTIEKTLREKYNPIIGRQ